MTFSTLSYQTKWGQNLRPKEWSACLCWINVNSKAYQLIDFAIGKFKVNKDVVKINEAKISSSKLDATLAPISGQVLGKNTWAMVDNKLNQD